MDSLRRLSQAWVVTILLTGGTGKTGRRVAHRLTATGRSIRVGSRSGQTRFDWEDQSTWPPALAHCSSAYITYAPDLAFAGAADTIATFAKTASTDGTTRLVLLSGRGDDGAHLAEPMVDLEDVADGIRLALGREPGDFTDDVRRTAREGTWNA